MTESLEVQRIEHTIQSYIEGLRSNNSNYLMKALETKNGYFQCLVHNTASHQDEVTSISFLEAAREWPRSPDQNAKGEIISVDAVDNKMAVVKVRLNYSGAEYIDYLSLYKLNGEWKIVNKVSINRELSE